MKPNIMVAVHESRDVETIGPMVQQMIDQDLVGKITLVHVSPLTPPAAFDFALNYADVVSADRERRQQAERLLHKVDEKIAWGAVEHEVLPLQGEEVDTLSRLAAERHVDSIVMVSHRHSWLGRLVSGHMADRIIDASGIPVMLAPEREQAAHKRGRSASPRRGPSEEGRGQS